MLDQLEAQSPDALLALIKMHAQDPREDKIDLGVGVYRTNDGATPVFRSIKAAEQRLVDTQDSKSYLGPEGDTGFVDEQGCLWLCGRLKDRLTVNGNPVDVLPLEKALDQLDGVERAALVQDPHRPAIAVCLQTRRPLDGPLLDQIVRWQQQQQLGALAVYPLTIPVDRRHNSKIDRAGLVSQLQAGKHKPSRLISASRREDHRHG